MTEATRLRLGRTMLAVAAAGQVPMLVYNLRLGNHLLAANGIAFCAVLALVGVRREPARERGPTTLLFWGLLALTYVILAVALARGHG